jgi:hypothetical protein
MKVINTVGELKAALAGVPDHILVGGSGHFGEKLEMSIGRVEEMRKAYNNSLKISVLEFYIEDAGEEPD